MAGDCDILIFLPHLGAGGTQKVATSMAASWAKSGRKVALATCWTRMEVHALDPAVERIRLNFEDFSRERRKKSYKIRQALERFQAYRKSDPAKQYFGELSSFHKWQVGMLKSTLEKIKPAYIVSFLSKTNIMTLLASQGVDCYTIVSERNDLERQSLEEPWNSLRSRLYGKADLVTANSQGTLAQLSSFVGDDRLCFLPNPVDLPPLPDPAARRKHFLTASRLVPQKAIDVMIGAFARIAAEAPDWELHVLGEGPMRDELETLARESGLEGRIRFHGFVAPAAHMAQARAYLLASRYEGLPNAMLEAMALALPVISSDASPGPLEFVEDGKTGFVFPVDDVEALAASMLRIVRASGEAEKMGVAAREKVEEFVAANGQAAWDEALARARRNAGSA